jgi:glycosyltransferase involved in cell wall biosynthesis
VFVKERVRHVAAHCEVVVVAPIPWFPFNRWIRGTDLSLTPFAEVQEGIPVYHPRFFCVPGLGKTLDGLLYFLSVLPFISWLRLRYYFDLIDAHFVYPDGLAGVLLGKVIGCPATITLRGSHDVRHATYFFRRPQIQFALKAATRLITVSDSLRRVAVGLGADPGKVCVIPNGVDSSIFRPLDRRVAREKLGLPDDCTILIAVSALIEPKGHHRILEILPNIIARRGALLYVAIGGEVPHDGYRQILTEMVDRHALERHVKFVPPQPHEEIPLWLATADLFCLATQSEGCCNAIMEALACGIPVVTTRVGGNPEFVRQGHDGFLVPFWNGDIFAAAILQALERDWDRAGIATRARANGWERTAQQVLTEFRQMIPPRENGLNDSTKVGTVTTRR